MKLFIKNMVNLQSLLVVQQELLKLGLAPTDIIIGEAGVLENMTLPQQLALRIALRQSGMVLLENKKEILVHRIMSLIAEVVYNCEEHAALNLSAVLAEKMGYDYTYLSNVFSEVTSNTIEKFYICHKIERVKQLILYDQLSLKEIAAKMHYCSTAHLSSQFRKTVGSTPSQFKQANREKRPQPVLCG